MAEQVSGWLLTSRYFYFLFIFLHHIMSWRTTASSSGENWHFYKKSFEKRGFAWLESVNSPVSNRMVENLLIKIFPICHWFRIEKNLFTLPRSHRIYKSILCNSWLLYTSHLLHTLFFKMTQYGLKWILNKTFRNVTFCQRDPPPPTPHL